MTIRNLDAAFKPSSVALIGASEKLGSVGRALAENLIKDFEGPVYLLNPEYGQLFGLDGYPEPGALPEVPDLAIIATPPQSVPELIAKLAKVGTRAACVITAGIDEGNGLRQAMLEAARPQLMRIIGPNCLGLQVPGRGLNASFAPFMPKNGSLAFIAQSGAMITAVLDWAQPRNIGFSCTVSMGDMTDVDFGDMLDYLANDRDTSAILLYMEHITHARKFMSAARAASRSKPVIVVKVGRFEAGARAAASHTGALAGIDGVYDAAFRRAGMLRVLTLEELFDAVETLASARYPSGEKLAILTNGGGIGVMAIDALVADGGQAVALSQQSIDSLDKVLPSIWSRANPVDILGDATADRYRSALNVLLDDDDFDGVLVMNCPTALAGSEDAANVVIEQAHQQVKKTLLTCWVGEQSAQCSRSKFREHRIPTYDSPEDAVHAFTQMVDYRRNQQSLRETPPSMPELFLPDTASAAVQIDNALDREREWLTEFESKCVLQAYGIPTVTTHIATTPQAVADIARGYDSLLVIKIVSAQIPHKSDVGGVCLDVDPRFAGEVAKAMLQRLRTSRPDAILEGFSVQAMVRKPFGRELLVGMVNDRQFGPVILFGQGGTAAELVNDKSLALPPLNLKLARELISRTQVSKLLRGYRNMPAANMHELEMVLVRLSQLVIDLPAIEELDINPLLVDDSGVVALDARIKVLETELTGADRLCIRPYPKQLEESVRLNDGSELMLRPIVPEDETELREAFGRLTEEEVRFRFFTPMKFLNHINAARFTQIDYDRQMALVLTEHGVRGKTKIFAVVRLVEDPDRARAEFAIVVDHTLAGQGLGTHLMKRILTYGRERGIGEVFGDVLWDNQRMLALCKELGFVSVRSSESPGVVRVSKKLIL